jgi:hypothetical protein
MKLIGEKRSTRGKTTLQTTNLTLTDLGSNPGLRGERSKSLSHGTAILIFTSYILWACVAPKPK